MSSDDRKATLYFPLLLLMALAIAIHLLPGLDASRLENGIRNGLHFILFAIVAAFAYFAVSYRPAGKVAFALAVVAGCAISAELLQQQSGGRADINDIIRDLAGATVMLIAVLMYSASGDAQRGTVTRLALRTAAVLTALLVVLPVSYWTGALLSERQLHPVVLDFDSRFAHYRFFPINAEAKILPDNDNYGNLLAELAVTRRARSGLAVQTATFDWSGYSELVFDAEVAAGPTRELSIHINDGAHIGHFVDTESGMLSLSTAQKEYRVPIRAVLREARRDDDIENIRQVVIFARDKHGGGRLLIDDIRLE